MLGGTPATAKALRAKARRVGRADLRTAVSRLGGAGAVWALTGVTALLAMATYLGWVRGLQPLGAPVRIPWWALAVSFLLAEIFAVHVQFRRDAYSFSLSEIPLTLGLIFATPNGLILGQVVGASVALAVHRRQSALKLAFNVSHLFLEACLAIVIFQSVVTLGSPTGPAGWAAAFLAAFVTNALADMLIGLAISLSERAVRLERLVQGLGFGLAATFANTSVGLIGATIVWVRPSAAWLLLVPVLGLLAGNRAYTAQREQHMSLRSLHETTRMLQRSPRLEEMMRTLLLQARKILRAETAEVVLLPHAGEERGWRMALASDGRTETERFELNRPGPWRLAVHEDRAVLLARPIRDQALRAQQDATNVKDSIIVPLHFEGRRVVGTLQVSNRLGDVSTFDEDDTQLLETLANHAGTALENAWLVNRLMDQMAIEAQENERRRIAVDIHDDSVQTLTAVGIGLGTLRNRLDGHRESARAERLEESVRGAIARLRLLIFELYPPALDEAGLAPAFRQYLAKIEAEAGIECQLEDNLARDPPTNARVLSYRIAQEALINARKHSRATKILVRLESRDGGVLVHITDNGVGFHTAQGETRRPGHLGLSAIRERAEMGGGWCRIDSAPGQGTRVRFWIPTDTQPLARPA